jgi:hypothetical protein
LWSRPGLLPHKWFGNTVGEARQVMEIYVWDYAGRLARIRQLTDEANRLTALVCEANANARAGLLRGEFRVTYTYSDPPDSH